MIKRAIVTGLFAVASVFYGCPAVIELLNNRTSKLAQISGPLLLAAMVVVGFYVVMWTWDGLRPKERSQ